MRTPVSTVAGPSVRAPRRAVPGAAVVLALALVGVVAAQGHTGDRRQQAGIVLVDPTAMAAPRPTAAAAQPHPVPVGQPQPLARIPVAEAQQRVPFPIRLPAQLPAGLILRGVIVAPGPSADGVPGPPQVDVGYGAADRPDAGLHIQETLGTVQGGYVVDATKAQQIVIAGHPAVYAPGAWQKGGDWDAGADSAILSWQADGMTYVLQYAGLGLTREGLASIATSVR